MVVVVYKKSKNSKKKYMTVFQNEQTPDRIINLNARKPLIPNEYIIEELGIGETFVEYWKKLHKISKHVTIQ